MALIRLSKYHPAVVQLLYTLLSGSVIALASLTVSTTAFAQGVTSPGVNMGGPIDAATRSAMRAACDNNHPPLTGGALAACYANGTINDPCAAGESNLQSASRDLGEACGVEVSSGNSSKLRDCTQKIGNCNANETDAAESDPSDAPDGNSCSAILNTTCPQMNAGSSGDYSSARTDANSTFNEAQTKINELQKQASDAQAKLARDVQEAQNRVQQEGLKLQDAQKANQLALSKALLEVNQVKSKAITDARGKMDAIDAQVVSINDAANRAQSAIANAASDIVSTCRKYAQTSYDSDLQKLNAKITQQDNTISNLGSATSMAYYTVRKAKEREKAKTRAYTGHYNACIAGVEGDGKAAANKVDELKRAANDALTNRAAQMQMLTKQRAEAADDLKTQEASLDDQIKQRTTELQADIESKVTAYNLMVSQTNQSVAAEQQAANQQQQQLSTQLTQAQQSLSEAQTAKVNANTRYDCYQRFGAKFSSSRATSQLDNWSKAPGAATRLTQACSAISSCTIASNYTTTCSALSSGSTARRQTPSTPSAPAAGGAH